jgi:hypothetical protein
MKLRMWLVSSWLLVSAGLSSADTSNVWVDAVEPYVTWLYSPDIRITGYYVKYGTVTSPGTNIVDAHYTNLVDLVGLMQKQKTNFVFVTAYDQSRNESGASTMLYFFFNNSTNSTALAPTNVCLIDLK